MAIVLSQNAPPETVIADLSRSGLFVLSLLPVVDLLFGLNRLLHCVLLPEYFGGFWFNCSGLG